jgi:hypothetical protein
LRLLKSTSEDLIFVSDSDGQYFEGDILKHLEQGKLGFKFVKGVKTVRKDSIVRKIGSRTINYYMKVFYKVKIKDCNSSHYLIHRELRDYLLQQNLFFTYSINIEIALHSLRSGLPWKTVEVGHRRRPAGISRGNPPLKILLYGAKTLQDIRQFFKVTKL